jgi:hypothetical protein
MYSTKSRGVVSRYSSVDTFLGLLSSIVTMILYPMLFHFTSFSDISSEGQIQSNCRPQSGQVPIKHSHLCYIDNSRLGQSMEDQKLVNCTKTCILLNPLTPQTIVNNITITWAVRMYSLFIHLHHIQCNHQLGEFLVVSTVVRIP